jgi:hypothetical protein
MRKYTNISHRVPGPETVRATEDPQARVSLEVYCEHHWVPKYPLAKDLVAVMGYHTENSPHYMKNLTDFGCILHFLCAERQDIQGVSKRAFQWYSKRYCVARNRFTLKGVQTIHRSRC